MARITKRVVDLLRPDPRGRDVFKWDAGDGALKGFGVRVKPLLMMKSSICIWAGLYICPKVRLV
jgi:hypothetical protein